jgi:hypothetical protein
MWKFQLHYLINEYQNYPILPPPFNIFIYIYDFCDFIRRRVTEKSTKDKKNAIEENKSKDLIIEYEKKFAYQYRDLDKNKFIQ